ncbi:MAG: tetrahydrofolate dehydrogenase/cyclohydrolase catalytic domain-containing protein [Patescibacteria group bacterium]|nr:tetrahydrofolate dehydrogenase/cyclohydrolase catalytic domain-containing protein [Patescibacteria group bacterium]
MEKILDGRALAQEIQNKIAQEIRAKKILPGLAVILVGDDPASHLYVNKKKKAAQEVGIDFHLYLLAADSSQEKIIEVIKFLNQDEKINAILVQLPLPKHLDTNTVIKAIAPQKDVDGFHPKNIQDFLADKALITPGLPLGILRLLEKSGQALTGKQAVIVSKSEIFFQPMAKILADRQMSVLSVKPDSADLQKLCQSADVLIVSCGLPFFIKADMVKPDAIIIDVGTNKIDNDYVVGDVDYSAVFDKVKFITPVPGGVGPMTVAMLLYNTLKLAENKKN